MKKVIALIMTLCLLMTAFAAVAEASKTVEARVVLQDEDTPEVVVIEEDGKQIIAKIYSQDGTVIAEILADGTLGLVDVHHREEIEDETASKRLSDAYDWVMHGVHYSDVESLKHDEELKIDINNAIASEELTAHDLIMYEMFDAMLYGEAAALLTDGAYVEFTVKMDEEQTTPILLIYTPDGENWQVLSKSEATSDNTVTIRLKEPGTIGFLLSHEDSFELGDSYEMDYTIVNTTTELVEYEMDSRMFTPSVSGKPAPRLVSYINENNEIIVGTIQVPGSTSVIAIPDKSYLVITPVSERDYVVDIQTHEHLEWSYDGILEAETIGHLRTGIGAEIDGQLATKGFDLNHFDLIVRDLFEVTIYGEYLDSFYTEGAFVELTFEEELTPNDPLVVIYSQDSVNWHTLPADNYEINANGTVTLRLEELGTVAFLVEAAETLPEAGEAVSSPV